MNRKAYIGRVLQEKKNVLIEVHILQRKNLRR